MTEKEEWFKEQCKQKGLSTEEIQVFGDCHGKDTGLDRCYATNRDGDFLYGIQLKEGSYEMGYVSAADLIEDGSFYAEWLYFLLVAMEPDRYEDQDLYGSRWHIDKLAICPCFHEAICRNRELPESYRHELRSQPVRGIFIPAQQDTYNQVMFGMWDTAEVYDKHPFPKYVLQSERLLQTEGYRFAIKVIDVERFIDTFGLIQEEGQFGPFRVLGDLEQTVLRVWKEEEKIPAAVWVSNFEKPYRIGPWNWIHFRFSHFEVEREPDAAYRTIFVVYKHDYDKRPEW
ncbi:MAG: hypothetical protein SPJ02_11555 [Parabacteroides sp.]|nr:hypothetical protein [Parabacteroides sp.]